jgi:hypothetical protein
LATRGAGLGFGDCEQATAINDNVPSQVRMSFTDAILCPRAI